MLSEKLLKKKKKASFFFDNILLPYEIIETIERLNKCIYDHGTEAN